MGKLEFSHWEKPNWSKKNSEFL